MSNPPVPAREMLANRFTIRGRVQGVGFRYTTRHIAQRLGLSGWARNRGDGSVEIWAQGTSEALRRLHDFLNFGPRGSRVDSLTVDEVDPDRSLTSFEVMG